MHATERERFITELVTRQGFVSFRQLERSMDASPATLRRDLERLASQGKLVRVRGGAKSVQAESGPARHGLQGVPFHENVQRHREEKARIGRAAAALCQPREAIMIDGGSTTLQMCRHLDGLNLQVLTNSLHIVSALLPQQGTRVLVPGGAVFREQNIILSASGDDDCMPQFHAPRLFMGAAAVGKRGVMQPDVVLVSAERRLIERAEEVILLVDSSKFSGPSGSVVCSLEEIDVVVTDAGVSDDALAMMKSAGIEVIIAN